MSDRCPECGGVLPAEGKFCPHCGKHLVADELPRPGEIVGKYRVGRQIGEGGMAVVYQAEDRELERTVALKILTAAEFDADDALARFRREAKITSRFNHPNAVTLYDYFVTEAGYPCLVLELVEGISVLDALSAGPFEPARAVKIATQVLDVLGEIERCGLVHRDITANNIMLVGQGAHERVKLLDFGIAKPVGPEAATGPLTVAGLLVGSPAYMAPEHCRGDELDIRSDLYSLGIVLYEMLVGVPPFDSTNYMEILRRQIHDKPPPLPSHVPQALRAVVARALEKVRDRRYQTPADFRDALRAVQADVLETPALLPEVPAGGTCTLRPADGSPEIRVQGTLVLGRSESADVTVRGEGAELVSARHAEVQPLADGRLLVRDLGSTNGTYVGSRRVRQAYVGDGETLRLAASGPEYRVSSRGRGHTGPTPSAPGRDDPRVPGVASWFRRWLGLSRAR